MIQKSEPIVSEETTQGQATWSGNRTPIENNYPKRHEFERKAPLNAYFGNHGLPEEEVEKEAVGILFTLHEVWLRTGPCGAVGARWVARHMYWDNHEGRIMKGKEWYQREEDNAVLMWWSDHHRQCRRMVSIMLATVNTLAHVSEFDDYSEWGWNWAITLEYLTLLNNNGPEQAEAFWQANNLEEGIKAPPNGIPK